LKGERPIHLAAEKGFLGVVTALLRTSAAVNVRTIEGDTPLHLAAERGHEEVVMVLILCGANINARNEEEGATALHYAALDSRVNVVKQLTAEGASKEIRSRNIPAVVGDEKSAVLLPSKTPLEAAECQLKLYDGLAADDIAFEELGEAKVDMVARQRLVVAHLKSFNPMSLFWTRQSHWRCLPWARQAVFTVLLVGEKLWREKDGPEQNEDEAAAGAAGAGGRDERPWLPQELWQYMLTFLRRKDVSSIRSHVASVGGAISSRTASGRRGGGSGAVGRSGGTTPAQQARPAV